MEQKNKLTISGYKNTQMNYSSNELEFLQEARDLAVKYQNIYNEKKLDTSINHQELESPQKTKKNKK